jgi:uncharacterized membrane protein
LLNKTEVALPNLKYFQTFGDLVLIFCFALAALAFGAIPPLSATIARPIVGTFVVLFVPGYAFIAALFPHKTSLNNGVRLGLSFGSSIAVVPLLMMVLNYTRWGVRLIPALLIIAVFTLVCVTAAGIRRLRLAQDERFAINWRVWQTPEGQQKAAPLGSRFNRVLSVVLVLAIGASLVAVSYAVLVPKPGEHFTEFYLLGANGTLGNYTTNYTVGVPSPVTVGIINHEARDVTYELVVSANNSTQRSTVYSEKVTIPDGQQWEKQIDLIINQLGDNVKLNFALYADPPTADPYRDTHIWVNVTA